MAQIGDIAHAVMNGKEALRQTDAYKFLNARQFDAVTYPLNSFLVLAGAGTGKTSVLINRFRYLIDELDVNPKQIMAVTFTNKAAKEIRNRLFGVFKHSPEKANQPMIGTFHSICLKMLREYSRYAGIAQNYTIWDSSDAEDKLVELAQKGYPRPFGLLSPEERELEKERSFVAPQDHLQVMVNSIDAAIIRIQNRIYQGLGESDDELRIIELKNALAYFTFLLDCAQGKKTVTYDESKINIARRMVAEISTFKESGWSSQKASEENKQYYDIVLEQEVGHYIPKFMFNRFNVDMAIRYLSLVVYRDYELYSQDNHLLDFSDLLMLSVKMLEEHSYVRDCVRQDYKAIMVDEFQDTNMLQYRWLKLITGDNTSIMVVGDDDQSIYGWRGAHPEYMQYFLYDFIRPRNDNFGETTREQFIEMRNTIHNPLEIIRLEQNYRSTANILSAANDMINLNQDRLGKTLFTKKVDDNPLIDMIQINNEFDLAKWIAKDIKQKIADSQEKAKDDPNVKPLKFDDFAVLYRTNTLGTKASSTFSQQNVPHVVYGGYNFYQRKEIKSALEWLNFILDMDNDLLFIKTFKQIPPTKRINPFSEKVGFITSLIDELEFERERSRLGRLIEALSAISTRFENEVAVMSGNFEDVDPFWVSPYATTQGMLTSEFHHQSKVTKIAQSITDYAKYLERLLDIIGNDKLTLHQAVFEIWKACGLWDFYRDAMFAEKKKEQEQTEKRTGKSTNAAKVSEAARSFSFLEDLHEQIYTWEIEHSGDPDYQSMSLEDKLLSYLNDVMLYTDKEESKKQEVDVVKLMTLHGAKGLEFKHVYLFGVSDGVFPSMLASEERLEEERRLFYVGITRAREHLTVTAFGSRSVFLDELAQHSFAVLNDLGNLNNHNIEALLKGEDLSLPYNPENKTSSGVMALQRKNAEQTIGRYQRNKQFGQKKEEKPDFHKKNNRLLGFLANE